MEQLASHSPGSHVQAGEVVGIVSSEGELSAEILVAPRNVGLLREEMEVRLPLDASNHNDWGHLTGSVLDISRAPATLARDVAPHAGSVTASAAAAPVV